jgi:hypothetical protein
MRVPAQDVTVSQCKNGSLHTVVGRSDGNDAEAVERAFDDTSAASVTRAICQFNFALSVSAIPAGPVVVGAHGEPARSGGVLDAHFSHSCGHQRNLLLFDGLTYRC